MIKTIPSREPGEIFRSDRFRWTYDDLREMPETMDRYEIIDGALYRSPSAHVRRHQRVVARLHLLFAEWVASHDWGEVFFAPADVVISLTQVVQPDLFLVAKDRLHRVDAYMDGAPDLIVEVISPSSVDYDRKTKFALYEGVGVREYWLVDPGQRSVEVFALRDERYEAVGRFEAGASARSALLDGFEADVAAIFG